MSKLIEVSEGYFVRSDLITTVRLEYRSGRVSLFGGFPAVIVDETRLADESWAVLITLAPEAGATFSQLESVYQTKEEAISWLDKVVNQ